MTAAISSAFSRESEAQETAVHFGAAPLTVVDRHDESVLEYPPLPYTTATLLEDATATLSWTISQVTTVAQTLFEAGLITYPRTDSTRVAPEAIQRGREILVQLFGVKAVGTGGAGETFPPPEPVANGLQARVAGWFKRPRQEQATRSEANAPEANTLEAHEAIRPTNPAQSPLQLASQDAEQRALYHLIWARFLASLMKPARYQVVTVTLEETA